MSDHAVVLLHIALLQKYMDVLHQRLPLQLKLFFVAPKRTPSFLILTRFPLKGAPKVKEVLAKNVPYAREAPKINFDRVFHTKSKTRSKLILEASRPGPLSP